MRREVSNEAQIMDFVWGKLNGKSWWPGQICDPSEASEQAVITQHPDHYVLVAYFGNNTFSWSNPSQLKPFRDDFSKMIKQMGSESFVSAVKDALCEMERCLRIDMTCSCVPAEGRVKVMFHRTDAHRKASMASYLPVELLKLLRDIGREVSVADMLEVTMLRSLIGAFCFRNGCLIKRTQNPIDEEPFDLSASPRKSIKGKPDQKNKLIGNRKVKRPEISEGESSRKERSMAELIEVVNSECKVVKEEKLSALEDKCYPSTRKNMKENANVKVPKYEINEGEENEFFRRRERKKSKYLSPPYTSGYLELSNSFNLADSEESESEPEILEYSGTPIHDILDNFLFAAINPLHGGRGHRTEEMKKFFVRHRNLFYCGIFDSGGLTEQPGESAGTLAGESALCVRQDGRHVKKGQASGDTPMKFGLNGVDDSETMEISNQMISDTAEERRTPLKRKNKDDSVNFGHTIHSSTRRNAPNSKRTKQEDSVALILTFSQGRILPSKDELNSKFSKYGSLNELETKLLQDQACARLVFQREKDAKKALNDIKRSKNLELPLFDFKSCYLQQGTTILSKSYPDNSLVYLSENLQRMISELTPEKKGLKSADGLKPEVLENLIDDMKDLLSKVKRLMSIKT